MNWVDSANGMNIEQYLAQAHFGIRNEEDWDLTTEFWLKGERSVP